MTQPNTTSKHTSLKMNEERPERLIAKTDQLMRETHEALTFSNDLSMRSEQLARDTHDIKMRVDILMNEVDVFDQFIYNIFHCLTQGWFSHSTKSS